jgi:6-pyruvoyltetrahydropterin/6-carboxytetrahydropterin synthase
MANKHIGYLTKRVMISSMHQLCNTALSDQENEQIFGKCFRVHGHNYYIEATIKGAIDPKSGLICDRDFFDDVLKREIVDRFDGKDLNKFYPNTTGENIAKAFFELLVEKLKPLNLVSVRLQETPKNFFTFGSNL